MKDGSQKTLNLILIGTITLFFGLLNLSYTAVIDPCTQVITEVIDSGSGLVTNVITIRNANCGTNPPCIETITEVIDTGRGLVTNEIIIIDSGCINKAPTIQGLVWYDVNGNGRPDEDLTIHGINDVQLGVSSENVNAGNTVQVITEIVDTGNGIVTNVITISDGTTNSTSPAAPCFDLDSVTATNTQVITEVINTGNGIVTNIITIGSNVPKCAINSTITRNYTPMTDPPNPVIAGFFSLSNLRAGDYYFVVNTLTLPQGLRRITTRNNRSIVTLHEGMTNLILIGVTDSPIAVSLASFEGALTATGIQLDWETGVEHRNLGFNLYRSSTSDQPDQLLTDPIIEATGLNDSAYTFYDEAPYAPSTQFYWLEDIDWDFVRTMHGPIEIVIPQKEIFYIPFKRLIDQGFRSKDVSSLQVFADDVLVPHKLSQKYGVLYFHAYPIATYLSVEINSHHRSAVMRAKGLK